MKNTIIRCFLSSILLFFVCCNDSSSFNKQINKTAETSNASIKTQKITKLPDNVLFKGESMTIYKRNQTDFKPLGYKVNKQSCINDSDKKVKNKLLKLGFKENLTYYQIKTLQKYNAGAEKFIVRLDKKLFSKINHKALIEINKFSRFTVFRHLYYLKNRNSEYLLLIGQESATSGMGHNYKSHLIIPLQADKSAIWFRSISDNPRRIGVSESGQIYYLQVDLDYNKMKENSVKNVPLVVSLFTSNQDKRLEAKFDLICKDLYNIFDK